MVVKVKCRFPKLCKYPHTDDGECDKFCSFNTREVKTNADRIRSMSDEELAKKMSGLESFALTCGGGWSPEKWLEWLRKECDDRR